MSCLGIPSEGHRCCRLCCNHHPSSSMRFSHGDPPVALSNEAAYFSCDFQEITILNSPTAPPPREKYDSYTTAAMAERLITEKRERERSTSRRVFYLFFYDVSPPSGSCEDPAFDMWLWVEAQESLAGNGHFRNSIDFALCLSIPTTLHWRRINCYSHNISFAHLGFINSSNHDDCGLRNFPPSISRSHGTCFVQHSLTRSGYGRGDVDILAPVAIVLVLLRLA